MTRRPATWLLVTLFAGSVLCTLWLLTGSVIASEADGRTWCGGSPIAVLHEGGGYNGGELREDQTAFDARCVLAARQRLLVAIAPGASAIISGGAIMAGRRRARAMTTRGAATYPSNSPTKA